MKAAERKFARDFAEVQQAAGKAFGSHVFFVLSRLHAGIRQENESNEFFVQHCHQAD